MATRADTLGQPATAGRNWWARSPEHVATELSVDVAAVECRSETATALTTATFDSKQMNWAMLGEFIVAVLVTQMDVFHRLLGTVDINAQQFGWALVPAVLLLALWEIGKVVARRAVHRAPA